MFDLGVCPNTGRVYEGNSFSGIPITGGIKLFPFKVLGHEIEAGRCANLKFSSVIFREDSFDPITKVRRGRIYKLCGSQPRDWHVQDYQRKDLPEVNNINAVGFYQRLERASHYIPHHIQAGDLVRNNGIVHIGAESNLSFWKVLFVEEQFDGSQLLTLKATKSFGTIPELLDRNIPQIALMSLKDVLDKIDISAGRLSAVDTVDRCRDALSIVFGALAENMTHDLGEGIRVYSKTVKNGSNLITNAADIVKRLHSRGKPNEVERYATRAVSEEDANLALNCLWFILVELGWAK